ncbi:MAG: phage holin family protein [Chloroflexaceae bacterium]
MMSEGKDSAVVREHAVREYEADTPQHTEHGVHRPQLAESGESIAHILGEMVADAQHLFRKELDLAKHEARVEVKKGLQGAIALAGGAAVAALGGLFLLFAVAFLLPEVFNIDVWLSFLIVGVVMAIIGAIMLLVGRSRLQQLDPTPHETIDSVRKDAEWIREQSPSGKK